MRLIEIKGSIHVEGERWDIASRSPQQNFGAGKHMVFVSNAPAKGASFRFNGGTGAAGAGTGGSGGSGGNGGNGTARKPAL